jgi:hypothetical protein
MGGARRWDGVWAAALALAAWSWLGGDAGAGAKGINPKVIKEQFEQARKDAEVVAVVRVLSASCTEVDRQPGSRSVTLELALQVVRSEKGPVKQGEILLVARKVNLPPNRLGPGVYEYAAAVRRFPFTPGVQGDVALRWDARQRRYAALAGWVEMPNPKRNAIPTEVGRAYVAGDAPPAK